MKPTSTVDTSKYVWRRAECTSLGSRIEHSSLRWLTLVWPRRDVPRCSAWYFFQPSIRAHHDDDLLLLLLLLLWCTLVWYVAAKDARWVRCSSSSLPGTVTKDARVHRQLAIYSVWVRRDAATAFAHRGCNRISTHRSLLVHLCEPRTAAVRVPGSAQSPYYLMQDLCHFRFENPTSRIVRFLPKIWRLGPSDFQSDFIPFEFPIMSDCIRGPIYFSDRKEKFWRSKSNRNKNQP